MYRKNCAPLNCLCGHVAHSRVEAGGHRQRCAQVRTAIKAEMQRMAGQLGHAPTTGDWSKLADRASFPSNTWICMNYGGWNAFLVECGLEPINASPEEYSRVRVPTVRSSTRYYWDEERIALQIYGVW